MQHVEEAGIHSGDSACVLPPHTLGERDARPDPGPDRGDRPGARRRRPAQRPVRDPRRRRLYVIEANPRASRTVPFVSKAIGLPVAKLACRIMLGERIADLDLPADTSNGHVCVKEVVLPFDRFAGADSLLGPEMRSTGEVMGIARDFPTAFAKAQAAAGAQLPSAGTAFITVADGDKPAATGVATMLHDLGFEIIATRGTAQAIRKMGIPAETDQQDRRGLAARRRLDRARRGRPRDQHAGRHRRAHRRLRDPHRGGRARDPVHHDDGRRDGGRPGDRRRAPRRARGDLAPGDPRAHGSAESRERPRHGAVRPPRGRRHRARASTAPTSCSAAPTRTARGRRPGSSTC